MVVISTPTDLASNNWPSNLFSLRVSLNHHCFSLPSYLLIIISPLTNHISTHNSGWSLLLHQRTIQHPLPQVRLWPTPSVLDQHNFNVSPHHHIPTHTPGRSSLCYWRPGQQPESQKPDQHPEPERPVKLTENQVENKAEASSYLTRGQESIMYHRQCWAKSEALHTAITTAPNLRRNHLLDESPSRPWKF